MRIVVVAALALCFGVACGPSGNSQGELGEDFQPAVGAAESLSETAEEVGSAAGQMADDVGEAAEEAADEMAETAEGLMDQEIEISE